MDSLVTAAWRIYHEAHQEDYVVTPSIPILFFGDSERYLRSPIKVLTVGLNPSRIEFPENDRFTRFQKARDIYPEIMQGSFYTEYLDALNSYFRTKPYTRWFKPSFEALLNGMGCSYFDTHESTALHTDLCSPLATDPTWSGLRGERARLEPQGNALWHDLVEHLRPDIVLVSIARGYLDRISFPRHSAWRTVVSVQRTNPYNVEALELGIDGKPTHLIFGRAANTPFGTVSGREKERIGALIKEQVLGR